MEAIPTKHKRMNHKFTKEEDQKLKKLVNNYGESAWDEIASLMPGRNPRQCHDRWCSYLSPNINNSPWTEEEDKRIIKLQAEFNGKWVQMSKRFKGRTDIQLRNRWNVLKKTLFKGEKQKEENQKIEKQDLKKEMKEKSEPLQEPPVKFTDTLDQIFVLFGNQEEDPDLSFSFPV